MNIEGIRQAIYTRLANYSALNAITQSIGYEKPQDEEAESLTPFPFTVIEDVSSQRWDTKDSDGGEQLVQITTFCRPTASKSAVGLANEAAQAVYDALHRYDLPVSGSNLVNLIFDEDGGNIPDPDGVTRYRPMTFRVQYDDGT